MNLSLSTDSKVRKTYPLFSGLFGYFGAALAGVANHSFKNNEKHNPGQPLHWSIDQSNDHADCVARHLLDLGEMIRHVEDLNLTNIPIVDYGEYVGELLAEADALAWRALALSQTLRMEYEGAPLPFNAKHTPVADAIERLENGVRLDAGCHMKPADTRPENVEGHTDAEWYDELDAHEENLPK